MRAAALLLAGLPVVAQAAPDGAYGQDCANPHSDSRVTLEGAQITFYESVCELADPVPVRGMDATLYDATCSGEGMEWDRRLMLMTGIEGELIVVSDGLATTYMRCGG